MTNERTANNNSMLTEKISNIVASLLDQRSLEIMDISSIMRNLASDYLFLKEAFAFSIKPLKFAPGLTPRAEWIFVIPMFTADLPVGPRERALGFYASL